MWQMDEQIVPNIIPFSWMQGSLVSVKKSPHSSLSCNENKQYNRLPVSEICNRPKHSSLVKLGLGYIHVYTENRNMASRPVLFINIIHWLSVEII
jgi:hypothetical protein